MPRRIHSPSRPGGSRACEPGKPFFFRAPRWRRSAWPGSAWRGVRHPCQQSRARLRPGRAGRHTRTHLAAARIVTVGAGPDVAAARAASTTRAGDHCLNVVAVADHPASYAAGHDRPGIAFGDVDRRDLSPWLREAARPADDELVLVTAHCGPNMTAVPVPHVHAAATTLEAAGATLIAGHSAHVPHDVRDRVLFDLGDFLDDYEVDRRRRNDLSVLWLVTLDAAGPRRVEGLPVRLDYGYARPADRAEAAALKQLLAERCAAVGSRRARRRATRVRALRSPGRRQRQSAMIAPRP